MKKFLALAVLATTATSFAASDRAITDIMYLPSAGTTFGLSDFASIGRSVKGEDSDDDASVSGVAVAQTIGHSISDRWLIAASLNYTTLEIDPEEGPKSDIEGFSDPLITARFRALDEEFTLDFLGSALISLGDKKYEDNGDQNNLQGGSAFEVGAQFGKKAESFSWALTAAVRNNFERTLDIETIGDVDGKSNNEYKLRADILNKLAEKSFLRSHFGITFQDALEADEGAYNIMAPYTIYNLGTEYQHLMSADLLLRGGIVLTQLNHDSAEIEKDIEARINIGATYQF
jgi:hypothetical protein